MKTALIGALLLSFGIACGCSTSIKGNFHPPVAGASKNEMFHLIVGRSPANFGWAVRLTVQMDGKTIAQIKNGDHIQLDLPPGDYVLTTKRGRIVGRSFPVATRRISGQAGETKCFSYMMTFGPRISSYFVYNTGWQINDMTLVPDTAEWEERDPHNPNRPRFAAHGNGI